VILDAHGVRLELPHGWSGHLFERDRLIGMHAASYPVALADTSTFGDQSTGRMRPGHAFVALVEYRPGNGGLAAGHGLFAAARIPLPLDPTSFSSHRLAHPRPGQVGYQHFFTTGERPFCVYVVVAGDRAQRRPATLTVDRMLRSLRVAPRAVEDSSS
jgi:hypothetical protein